MRTVAKMMWLILREGWKAFDDSECVKHTEPWKGRCTQCGHRLQIGDEAVIETRYLPWSDKFAEVPRRARAILQGA